MLDGLKAAFDTGAVKFVFLNIAGGNEGLSAISAKGITLGQWPILQIDVPQNSYRAMVDLRDVKAFFFDGKSGSLNIYL